MRRKLRGNTPLPEGAQAASEEKSHVSETEAGSEAEEDDPTAGRPPLQPLHHPAASAQRHGLQPTHCQLSKKRSASRSLACCPPNQPSMTEAL